MMRRRIAMAILALVPLAGLGISPASAANLRSVGCSTLSGHLHGTVTVTDVKGNHWYYSRLVYASQNGYYWQDRTGLPDIRWDEFSITIKDTSGNSWYRPTYGANADYSIADVQSNGGVKAMATFRWQGKDTLGGVRYASCTTPWVTV